MDKRIQAAREAIAGQVLAEMGRRRISQERLAELVTNAGVPMSQAKVSRRLTCKQPFDTDELLAIAKVFDAEVTAMVPVEARRLYHKTAA